MPPFTKVSFSIQKYQMIEQTRIRISKNQSYRYRIVQNTNSFSCFSILLCKHLIKYTSRCDLCSIDVYILVLKAKFFFFFVFGCELVTGIHAKKKQILLFIYSFKRVNICPNTWILNEINERTKAKLHVSNVRDFNWKVCVRERERNQKILRTYSIWNWFLFCYLRDQCYEIFLALLLQEKKKTRILCTWDAIDKIVTISSINLIMIID